MSSACRRARRMRAGVVHEVRHHRRNDRIAGQRDPRERHAENCGRQEAPGIEVIDAEQQPGQDGGAGGEKPRPETAQDRAAKERLLADRRRQRHQEQGEQRAAAAVGGRDGAAQAPRRPPWAPEGSTQRGGRPPARPTDQSARAPATAAADGARSRMTCGQLLSASARVEPGQAPRPAHSDSASPGPSRQALQRNEHEEEQDAGDAVERERVAGVGGSSSVPRPGRGARPLATWRSQAPRPRLASSVKNSRSES